MIVLQGGVVNPTPSPQLFWRKCFLSGLSPLAGWSQFESVRNSLFALAWLSCKNVAQESRRGHACIGLGRNRWHYPSFDSTHPSARCVPLGPHTTPSTPTVIIQNVKKGGRLQALRGYSTHLNKNVPVNISPQINACRDIGEFCIWLDTSITLQCELEVGEHHVRLFTFPLHVLCVTVHALLTYY
jgi:hypothetical protein